MNERTIVIVGGGFAGTSLAQALERRLPEGWQLILLSEESYTTFNPMLAEVVGAAVFPEHVVAPIRTMLKRTRFIMGRLTAVDLRARRLSCTTLAGTADLGWTHLVLAFGLRANLELLPGMAEHALPLKLVGDAMHIRNRVLQRLAAAELSVDSEARRACGRFVVIGGGFSGVEVAGALADFIAGARRFYPRVAAQDLGVTLLHQGERLLPEMPAALGEAAEASLRRRGVQVRLKSSAAGVEADRVVLSDGSVLPAGTVVCTIGTRPNRLVERLKLPAMRGRLVTRADMSVPDHDGLWALGDCAAVPNGRGGQISPPTAQFAVAQAQVLADNLLAVVAGQPTRAFAYRSKGMMATTGHRKGVADIYGLHITGWPAWLLWRAAYLMRMPTLGRKLRIGLEWTLSLFFPADITHLRFTCTAEAEAVSDRDAAPSSAAGASERERKVA